MANPERNKGILAIINKERKCQEWYQYTPGLDPKEHLDELRVMRLELERQQFQTQMANDQKAIMLKLDDSNKRVQLILGFVLGGIAVLEIIVGVLQVVYPTGFPWLQNILGITPPSTPYIPPVSGLK